MQESHWCLSLVVLQPTELLQKTFQDQNADIAAVTTYISQTYLPNLIWKYITRLPMKGQFFTTPKQMLTILNKQWIFFIGRMSIFSNTVLNILNNYIPHETKICDDRDPPWMTTKIKELISQKNKLYSRIKKRNNSFLDKQLLHSLQQHLSKSIENAKNK